MANSYVINFVDPLKATITVAPNTINGPDGGAAQTDINLVGAGSAVWGEKILENMVHILENFSSEEDMYDMTYINGQTFTVPTDARNSFVPGGSFFQRYNSNGFVLFLPISSSSYDSTTDITTVIVTGGSAIQNVPSMVGRPDVPKKSYKYAATDPIQGQFWYNQTKKQINIWDGTTWGSIGGIVFSDDAPLTATNGEFWWDTNETERNLYLRVSGAWIRIVDDYLLRDGTKPMAATLDMGGNSIIGLTDPTDNTDPLQSQYATTVQFTEDTYVNVSGDTMTAAADLTFSGGGQVRGLPATPSAGAAASKEYVDTKLALDGTVPMGGNLDMGGNRITSVAQPASATDVVTREYLEGIAVVDTQPVDTIYITKNAGFNANAAFPGTWELLDNGVFLLNHDPLWTGTGSGGFRDSITVQHSHGTTGGGSHRHLAGSMSRDQGARYGSVVGPNASESHRKHRTYNRYPYTDTVGNHTHGVTSAGGSGTDKNLPPYLVTYMWIRTA